MVVTHCTVAEVLPEFRDARRNWPAFRDRHSQRLLPAEQLGNRGERVEFGDVRNAGQKSR
jgi:hypothetical protein